MHFPDIPMQNEDPNKVKENKNEDADRLARIEAQLNSVLEDNKALRASNFQLMAQPTQQSTVSVQKPQEMTYDNMPDPVEKPKEYAKELEKRLVAKMALDRDYESQQQQGTQQRQQRIAGLWTGFSTKYPELSKDQSRVEFAATKVAEEMKAKGIDLDKYMFTTQDTFFNDLKAKMEDIFGEKDEAEDDNSRSTAAIGPGAPQGVVKGNLEPTSSNMIADLQKMQRTSGFF